MLGYCTAAVYQLLMFCYWGEQLSHQSALVAQAAYDCPWIDRNIRFKKTLIILITRAQRPICITAGKFAKLSLVTFIAVSINSGPGNCNDLNS